MCTRKIAKAPNQQTAFGPCRLPVLQVFGANDFTSVAR